MIVFVHAGQDRAGLEHLPTVRIRRITEAGHAGLAFLTAHQSHVSRLPRHDGMLDRLILASFLHRRYEMPRVGRVSGNISSRTGAPPQKDKGRSSARRLECEGSKHGGGGGQRKVAFGEAMRNPNLHAHRQGGPPASGKGAQ